MKKLIITKNQLKCINENAINIAATAKGNSISDFSNTLSNVNTQTDINKAGRMGDVNLTISGPDTNDSQPTQIINVEPGDTAQNAITNQANDELIRSGGSVKVSGDGFGESKIYTKKTIEEIRVKNLKKV